MTAGDPFLPGMVKRRKVMVVCKANLDGRICNTRNILTHYPKKDRTYCRNYNPKHHIVFDYDEISHVD